MSFKARLYRRRSGEIGVAIPTALSQKLGLESGIEVSLAYEAGALVVRPAAVRRRRYTLRQFLKGKAIVRRLNADTAWSQDGPAEGNEIA